MKNQRGHFDLTFIYWLAGIAGVVFTGGGLVLLRFAMKGLWP